MSIMLCQRDAYRRDCDADVLSCAPSKLLKDHFDVTLSESVLFAEGGGQPSDYGELSGGVRVVDVRRAAGGATITHVAAAPLDVGARVRVSVDWPRRFDHMQQHSSQHLISALAVEHFAAPTVSWGLLSDTCYIDFDTQGLAPDDLQRLEDITNERIRAALPVRVRELTRAQLAAEPGLRSRGIPDDVEVVRLIEIEGVDMNTCCGTHVSRTSELQLVKFLGAERKARGVRVTFVAGERAVRRFAFLHNIGQQLSKLLSCGPEKHAPAVDKLQQDLRAMNSERKVFMRELSEAQARALAGASGADAVAHVHHECEQANAEYAGMLARAFTELRPDRILLVTSGKAAGSEPCAFQLVGPEKAATAAMQLLRTKFAAKGGGRGRVFQGSVPQLGARSAELSEALRGVSSDSASA